MNKVAHFLLLGAVFDDFPSHWSPCATNHSWTRNLEAL